MDEKELTQLINDIKAGFDTSQAKQGDIDTKMGKVEAYIKELGGKVKTTEDELKAIAIKLQAPPMAGGDKNEESKRLRAKMFHFLRTNIRDPEVVEKLSPSPEIMKALTVSNDTTGGVLTEPEYEREILKTVTEYSPIRDIATVKQISANSLIYRKRTGVFTAAWIGETGTRSEKTGLTWDLDKLPTNELYAFVDITHQNLADSKYNLEAELRNEFAEQFGVAEGTAYVSGNAVGKPEGILTNTSVSHLSNTSTSAIQAKVLRKLPLQVKEPYHRNAKWLMKRATMAELAAMTDGSGKWLFPELQTPFNGTFNLMGYPVVLCADMPAATSGLFPIAFGDFAKAYWIADHVGMTMLRDPFSAATAGSVRFHAYRQVGAQVVQPEAIYTYEMSSS
jgi:HK97 family phage major capsid protein